MIPANDPTLRSFVPVAADSPFPIQNLPFGVFTRRGDYAPRIGVAMGEHVLDLTLLAAKNRLDLDALQGRRVFDSGGLNEFMAAGRAAWSATRARVSHLLRADVAELRDDAVLREQALLPMSEAVMQLPADIGDYTDFYSSREHATNVGTMLRGADNALMPNWLHLPVAYHGRASSIVVSGTDVRRPRGQSKPDKADGSGDGGATEASALRAVAPEAAAAAPPLRRGHPLGRRGTFSRRLLRRRRGACTADTKTDAKNCGGWVGTTASERRVPTGCAPPKPWETPAASRT